MVRGRVLVVDDEPAMLENYERLLARAEYACTTLADPLRFRQVLAEVKPDVLITDLRMPGADGMTLLAAARADDPSLPVLIVTAYATVASAVAAIREGAFDYVAKPFTSDQLLVAVDRAVRYRNLSVENQELKQRVAREADSGGILGASAVVTRLLDQIRKVAPTEANILITGESGTGKELVARYVHQLSARKQGPLVPVDCASLPDGLLETELFGHEKGAFTGAVSRRNGLLVEGNGGTVFLDEIGDLGLPLQAKLLRTLEQRQIRRVGDSRLIDLDIRVIAATNVDLEKAVASGSFRQDLYFRLNVVHLHVPPLRARAGDLPMLMKTFIDRYAVQNRVPVPRVTPEVWQLLERYEWPGNVREVKNLVQRLVVLNSEGVITPADLPEQIRFAAVAPKKVDEPLSLNYEVAQEQAIRLFRTGYVARLLELSGGNVTRAARAAGVSRRTFHRWIAELESRQEVTI